MSKPERATCAEHTHVQGCEVTYEPEATEDEPDEHDCPMCFSEHVQRNYENVFARLWALLNPNPDDEDVSLSGLPLHARAAVAWKLCEGLSERFSIDGTLAEQPEYEADEEEVRKLAKLPPEFRASEAIADLREVCQDVLDRLKLPRTASKSTKRPR